jgi:c-opsin
MSLSALAYERYIRVVYAQVVDFPWAWRCITHIWLYSLAWTGAPLLGWNRYTLEIHQLGCSLDWTSKDPIDASFILLFLLACFFVPVGIMIYCYMNILYTVRMVRRRARQSRSSLPQIFFCCFMFTSVWFYVERLLT